MIDLLRRILSQHTENEGELQHNDTIHDIRIAACALLLEMATIDGEFSGPEKENIVTILKQEHGLSDDMVESVIKASEQELEESVDLWQFASTINNQYSVDEKIRVMEMIWKIVYADGHLDQHEDYLAHKISRLLRLSHPQLIGAKLKVLGKE
jgi:uncharacterized tellurite resistance protein B-like protein